MVSYLFLLGIIVSTIVLFSSSAIAKIFLPSRADLHRHKLIHYRLKSKALVNTLQNVSIFIIEVLGTTLILLSAVTVVPFAFEIALFLYAIFFLGLLINIKHDPISLFRKFKKWRKRKKNSNIVSRA